MNLTGRSPAAAAQIVVALVASLCLSSPLRAAIPSAEKILPDDTLVMVTIPDVARALEIYQKTPQQQLLQDPAMKAFREKFISRWKEEFLTPLERELGVKAADFAGLLQGQVTFAITQNGLQSASDQDTGRLLLIDTKDKHEALKNHLAELRKKWIDSGKPLKTEKIRDSEFLVLPISDANVPGPVRMFFPNVFSAEATEPNGAVQPPGKRDVVIGQFDSLLIVGNALKPVERLVMRLGGGAVPTLGELAVYETSHLALFRDAPFYAWMNVKPYLEAMNRQSVQREHADAFDPFGGLTMAKLLSTSGLAGLKTVALNARSAPDGLAFEMFLNVPEPNRQGLLKIIAGEPKDSTPPAFVPADAVKFQRWRIDGQKAWATLEKMFNEVSPSTMNAVNFIIDTANAASRSKDPDFDLRKNLLGNLGDDLMRYEKAPRGTTLLELGSPPSLLLIGSPQPEQLAAALRGVFIILDQQAGTPAEREFLGRKIYTVTVPSFPFGLPNPNKPLTRTLSYAASGSYVAITTDAGLLEEFLRSGENPPKALRDAPGLTEAMQHIGGGSTGFFAFENQIETMRVSFQTRKLEAASPNPRKTFAPLPGAPLVMPETEKSFQELLDYSLLPPFEQVAKFFHYAVYSSSANVDGLTIRWFAPTPPELRK